MLAYICHIGSGPFTIMPRITVELSVEEHRALKLLTIVEGKKLGAVLKEAINSYLLQKGAHDLEVKGKQ